MSAFNPDASTCLSCCDNRTIATPIVSYVVNTVAALRAMSTSLVQLDEVAQTLGYYSPGDNGGNMFYWSPSEVTTDNGGNFIKPADKTVGRWVALINDGDVRKFGAIGDGVNNDTAAITSAIASCPAVRLCGTHKITSTLTFKSGTATQLLGRGATIVTSANIPMITVDGVNGRMDGCVFDGFNLYSTGDSNTNDVGILFQDTSAIPLSVNYFNNGRIQNINFWGLTYGIRNTRNANASEGGLNWTTFHNLGFWQQGHKLASYCIKFDNGGGGTGNIFSTMTMSASVACIQMGQPGNSAVQNIGDILFSGLHMGLATYGIRIRGGAAYNSNVSVIGCQMDAAIVNAIDFNGSDNFVLLANNWGGGANINLTNCNHFIVEKSTYPVLNLTSCSHYTILGQGELNLTEQLVTPSGILTAGLTSTSKPDFQVNVPARTSALRVSNLDVSGNAPQVEWFTGYLGGEVVANAGAEASGTGSNFYINTLQGGSMTPLISSNNAGLSTFNKAIALSNTSATWSSGTGSPETVVTATVGSMYTRTNGGAGTTLYVKESGSGNTGWQSK